MPAVDRARLAKVAPLGGRATARNDAIREVRFTEHAEYIRRIVAEAPPLSELQRARLAAILLTPVVKVDGRTRAGRAARAAEAAQRQEGDAPATGTR